MIEMLIVIAIILVLLGVAIPNFLTVRHISAETVVLRELHAIYEAQAQYVSQFGHYAATLAELGPATGGAGGGPWAGNLIPARLASGEKDGYAFELMTTPGGFAVTATPKVYGSTGRRSFYVEHSGVVRQNWGPEPATAASEELR